MDISKERKRKRVNEILLERFIAVIEFAFQRKSILQSALDLSRLLPRASRNAEKENRFGELVSIAERVHRRVRAHVTAFTHFP